MLVGDSIMEGAAQRLRGAFSAAGYEVVVDTAVSRSTLAGADMVRFYTAAGADAVVVMLGANDSGDAEVFRSRVRAVVQAARGVPLLVWMTIPEVRAYYPAANAVLREELSARPGGSLLQWHRVAAVDGVTAGDGLHLTPAGVETMTGFVVPMVVAAIRSAQDPRGAPDALGDSGGGGSSGGDGSGGANPGGGDGDGSGGSRPGGSGSDGSGSGTGESEVDGPSGGGAGDDTRNAVWVVDPIDSLVGPGGLFTAATLVAGAMICGGVGLALWSLWRTRARNT